MPRGCGDGGQDEQHEGFARQFTIKNGSSQFSTVGSTTIGGVKFYQITARAFFIGNATVDILNCKIVDNTDIRMGAIRVDAGARRCSTTAWLPTMRPSRRRRTTAAACGPTDQTAADQQLYVQQQQGVRRSSLYLRLRRHGQQDQCADQQHHDFGQQRQSRACDPKRRQYLRPRKRQPGDRQFDGLRQPFREGRRYRGLRQGQPSRARR